MRISTILFGLMAGCAAIPTEPTPPVQVTFIGDSITAQLGDLESLFGPVAQTWVNAGVPGDLAGWVRARIDRDVPATSVACVVLVGINDIWGGAGDGGAIEDLLPPGTQENGFQSVANEIDLSVQDLRGRGIQPVLGTVMPVSEDYPRAETFNPKVRILNAWIRQYATTNGVLLIDYYAVFVDGSGNAKRELVEDGLHPNSAGRSVEVTTALAALHHAQIIP